MNDTFIIPSKPAKRRLNFRIVMIVLLALAVSGGYYIWKENEPLVESLLPETKPIIKIYGTSKQWNGYETYLFNCITEIQYNQDPIINISYSSIETDDKQKIREECIPL